MRRHALRRPFVAAGGLAAAVTLAACGSSGGSASTPPTNASTSPAAALGGTNRGPAASGAIAAITGRTMQVQNPQSGQVAVRWTASTAFSHEVVVSAAKIAVGSCVMATASTGSSASSFTATRLVLSSPTGGTCNGGGAFPRNNRPSGAPVGQRPSGFPTNFPSGARPSGFPGGGARSGSFAAGTVTARSGNTVTVTMPAFGSSAASTKRTVLLASSTKVYEQARTTAKSLAVGRCVTAVGKTDASGAVTASRVQITTPTGGTCTTGFARVGNGG